MKRMICLIAAVVMLSFALAAMADQPRVEASVSPPVDQPREEKANLGSRLADAFKRFGSNLASASGDMFESVKGAFEDDDTIKSAADSVKNWTDEAVNKVKGYANTIGDWAGETAPKIGGFFTDLWGRLGEN